MSPESSPTKGQRARITMFKALFICASIVLLFVSSQAEPLWGGRDLCRNDISEILSGLRSDSLQKIPSLFFGNLYDPGLADLIVFSDSSGEVSVKLVQNGKVQEKLFGKRYLWAMVFAAGDPPPGLSSTKSGTDTTKSSDDSSCAGDPVSRLEVRLECLTHRLGVGEAGLLSVAKTFASAVIGRTQSYSTGAVTDNVIDTVDIYEIMPKDGHAPEKLYFGIAKLELGENVVHRIRVERLKTSNAYATFGNYSASRVAASCGIVGVWQDPSPLEGDKDFDAKVYVFSHFYISRPNLPVAYGTECKRCSWSLVLGTEFTDKNFLDNVAVGIGIGHLLGMSGLVAGYNFSERQRVDGSKYYVRQPFLGLNYAL